MSCSKFGRFDWYSLGVRHRCLNVCVHFVLYKWIFEDMACTVVGGGDFWVYSRNLTTIWDKLKCKIFRNVNIKLNARFLILILISVL